MTFGFCRKIIYVTFPFISLIMLRAPLTPDIEIRFQLPQGQEIPGPHPLATFRLAERNYKMPQLLLLSQRRRD